MILNATVLVLHMALALTAKPLLASDVAGGMTVGVLLLLGHGLFLLWTARRYTSARASMSRGQA
ncbi:hypothetical protein [Streptomyces sp. NPDC060065]|uniref:hypothetical protein n=1 Tax=Streptomyces sp. NPDC060065 TaxID=3347050 RepID=UPI0036CEAD38